MTDYFNTYTTSNTTDASGWQINSGGTGLTSTSASQGTQNIYMLSHYISSPYNLVIKYRFVDTNDLFWLEDHALLYRANQRFMRYLGRFGLASSLMITRLLILKVRDDQEDPGGDYLFGVFMEILADERMGKNV